MQIWTFGGRSKWAELPQKDCFFLDDGTFSTLAAVIWSLFESLKGCLTGQKIHEIHGNVVALSRDWNF